MCVSLQRAAAVYPGVKELNPLVNVSRVEGTVDGLSDDALKGYALVCMASPSMTDMAVVDGRCRALGVGFIGSCTAGLNAVAFFDFGSHTFTKCGWLAATASACVSPVIERLSVR